MMIFFLTRIININSRLSFVMKGVEDIGFMVWWESPNNFLIPNKLCLRYFSVIDPIYEKNFFRVHKFDLMNIEFH